MSDMIQLAPAPRHPVGSEFVETTFTAGDGQTLCAYAETSVKWLLTGRKETLATIQMHGLEAMLRESHLGDTKARTNNAKVIAFLKSRFTGEYVTQQLGQDEKDYDKAWELYHRIDEIYTNAILSDSAAETEQKVLLLLRAAAPMLYQVMYREKIQWKGLPLTDDTVISRWYDAIKYETSQHGKLLKELNTEIESMEETAKERIFSVSRFLAAAKIHPNLQFTWCNLADQQRALSLCYAFEGKVAQTLPSTEVTYGYFTTLLHYYTNYQSLAHTRESVERINAVMKQNAYNIGSIPERIGGLIGPRGPPEEIPPGHCVHFFTHGPNRRGCMRKNCPYKHGSDKQMGKIRWTTNHKRKWIQMQKKQAAEAKKVEQQRKAKNAKKQRHTTCWLCNQQGHTKTNCPQRLNAKKVPVKGAQKDQKITVSRQDYLDMQRMLIEYRKKKVNGIRKVHLVNPPPKEPHPEDAAAQRARTAAKVLEQEVDDGIDDEIQMDLDEMDEDTATFYADVENGSEAQD